MNETSVPRRVFLRRVFLAAAAAIPVHVLQACAPTQPAETQPPAGKAAAGATQAPAATTAPAPTQAPAATTAPAASGRTFKVAAVYPQSGPFAFSGKGGLQGLEWAVKDINAKGGIKALGGIPMELIISDSGSTAEAAASAASRVLARGDISVGLGAFFSDLTLAVTEVAERMKVPWVGDAFADTVTTRGLKYTFCPTTPASQVARVMFTTVQDLFKQANLPGKRIAILTDQGAFSVATAKGLRDVIANSGAEIILDEVWAAGLTDATPIAQKVRSAAPDSAFISVGPAQDMVLVIQKFQEFRLTTPVFALGTSGVLPSTRDAGGNALANRLASFVNAHPTKRSKTIADAIQKEYNLPYTYQDQLLGVQAAWIAKEAAEAANSTEPDKVRDALANLNVTSGALADLLPTGALKFDATGRVLGDQLVLAQWQDVSGTLLPCTVWPTDLALCPFQTPK